MDRPVSSSTRHITVRLSLVRLCTVRPTSHGRASHASLGHKSVNVALPADLSPARLFVIRLPLALFVSLLRHACKSLTVSLAADASVGRRIRTTGRIVDAFAAAGSSLCGTSRLSRRPQRQMLERCGFRRRRAILLTMELLHGRPQGNNRPWRLRVRSRWPRWMV